MIREKGPSYCHYTHRQQDMMENHCLGRDGLAMATCKHCGAEGVVDHFECAVCKIGEFGSEEEYKGPVPYGYCEKCSQKGYLGYCCATCKADPNTGEYPKCIGHKLDTKSKGTEDNDMDKDENNKEDKDDKGDSKPPSSKRHKGNDENKDGDDGHDNNEWGTPSDQNWGNSQGGDGGWGSKANKNNAGQRAFKAFFCK